MDSEGCGSGHESREGPRTSSRGEISYDVLEYGLVVFKAEFPRSPIVVTLVTGRPLVFLRIHFGSVRFGCEVWVGSLKSSRSVRRLCCLMELKDLCIS